MERAERVLHVDDDPDFAALTARYLAEVDEGLDVVTERRAADALERLEAEQFDCIVSDYQMPEMDGLEFLEAVRADDPDLPFILFTGKGSEEVASEAITAGATDYLQKGSGRGRYELLANRVRNAIEQYRDSRRADELERIRQVVRDANRALTGATSRADVEARVCELLSDAEPYRFAWIGDHDPDARTIEPRTAAGIEEGYLDAIEITTDEEATARGPTGRAVRSRELAVMQNIPANEAYEPWRADALERGYRSSAAIPLGYDGHDYGVLNVYANRVDAFDQREQNLLRELAADVGHAIYRIEGEVPLERYQRTVEHLPVGVCRLSPEGEILDANPAFAEILGADSQAWLEGRDLAEFLDDPAELGLIRRRLDRDEAVRERVVCGETAEGDDLCLSVTALRTEEGGEVYYDGIVADVTEGKRREHELQLFKQAVEASGHSIYFTDTDGTIEYVNPAFEAVTGYSAEEAIGRTPRILKSGRYDADFYVALWDTILSGEVWRRELWNSQRSGEPYAVDQTIAPVEGRSGDVEHFVAVNADVTDRKRREGDLERYETIIQASGDAVYMLDPSGRFTFVNEALTRITGYDEAELLGEHASMLMDQADVETGLSLVRDLVASDRDRAKYELSIQAADGTEIPMENHLATIETDDGDLESSVGIVRDVSDRKARERELERQNERLEEFAAVASHDLRNPLNVAMSRVTLMEETDPDNEHVEPLQRSLGRMEALIEDLLTLTREGSAVEETVPVHLGSVVEDCWRHVDTEAASLGVRTDLTLRADASRLKQLLENLFRNAVEHGGSDVAVTVGDLPEGFYVADDGQGIPDAKRDRIFESGFTTGSQGTGLGLNIVEQIVEAHGWTVTATESEAGGARFEISGVDIYESTGPEP